MSGFKEYRNYDGLGLAELVRKKEVAPIDLVEEAVRRIEALNPQLNAVIHKMYDSARKLAQGRLPDAPFAGVPFLLKDLVAACANEPIRKGCRFFADYVADHDTELVARFKAAGLIILGKTNVPEFGLAPVTESALFGPCRNPWDVTRTPGGSSGGSAAAVAARMVPMAHGNDGGGSIRAPASCCGLFGLKPSRGRIPTGPDYGDLWLGFAVEHVLTRTVRDSAAMLDVTAGPDVGVCYVAPPPGRPFLEEVAAPPGKLRIAFTSKPFMGRTVHADCLEGLEATAKLLQELGHEVAEAAPEIDGQAFATAYVKAICGDVRADIEEAEELIGRKATPKDFEPATWAFGLMGQQVSSAEAARSLRFLQGCTRHIGRFFENYDVLLTPTLSMPPVTLGALGLKPAEVLFLNVLSRLNAGWVLRAMRAADVSSSKIWEFIPYTPVFNVTGQPAMSVPLHWNAEGLPIGMHFVGRYGDEATLLRLAGQLEEAKPWFERTAPLDRDA
jgi:amidase